MRAVCLRFEYRRHTNTRNIRAAYSYDPNASWLHVQFRPGQPHTCAVHQVHCELSSLAVSAQLPGWSQDVLKKSIVKCLEMSLLMKAEFTCESFLNSITSSLNAGAPLPVYTLQSTTRLQNTAGYSSHPADACRPCLTPVQGRREAIIRRKIL